MGRGGQGLSNREGHTWEGVHRGQDWGLPGLRAGALGLSRSEYKERQVGLPDTPGEALGTDPH